MWRSGSLGVGANTGLRNVSLCAAATAAVIDVEGADVEATTAADTGMLSQIYCVCKCKPHSQSL